MIYNHLNPDIVQDVILDDISDIIEDIYDEYMKLRRFETLSIYASSDIARKIIAGMLEFEDTYFNEDSDTYLLNTDSKILITLAYDGDIFIEDAYFRDELLVGDSVINYIQDNFKQNDVIELSKDADPVLVFGFTEDDEECDDYYDNNYRNFTLHINGKEVTNEIDRIYALRELIKYWFE